MATVMPRSLNEPVGFAPSILRWTSHPVSSERCGAGSSGVPPSRSVTTSQPGCDAGHAVAVGGDDARATRRGRRAPPPAPHGPHRPRRSRAPPSSVTGRPRPSTRSTPATPRTASRPVSASTVAARAASDAEWVTITSVASRVSRGAIARVTPASSAPPALLADGRDAHVVLGEHARDLGEHARAVGDVEADVVAGAGVAHGQRSAGRRGRSRAARGPPMTRLRAAATRSPSTALAVCGAARALAVEHQLPAAAASMNTAL